MLSHTTFTSQPGSFRSFKHQTISSCFTSYQSTEHHLAPIRCVTMHCIVPEGDLASGSLNWWFSSNSDSSNSDNNNNNINNNNNDNKS
jgi:hypothetical protein